MKGNYKAAMDSLHIPVDFQASTVRAMQNAKPRRRRRAVRLAPLAACLCVLLALLPTLFGGGGYGAGGAGSMAADGNALLYWGLGSIRRFDPASGQTATLAKGAGALFCVRRDTLYYTAGTTLYAADPATGGGRALYTVTLPYPVRAIQLCGVHDDTATLEAYPKRDGDGIRLVDVRLTDAMALGDRPYEYETAGEAPSFPGTSAVSFVPVPTADGAAGWDAQVDGVSVLPAGTAIGAWAQSGNCMLALVSPANGLGSAAGAPLYVLSPDGAARALDVRADRFYATGAREIFLSLADEGDGKQLAVFDVPTGTLRTLTDAFPAAQCVATQDALYAYAPNTGGIRYYPLCRDGDGAVRALGDAAELPYMHKQRLFSPVVRLFMLLAAFVLSIPLCIYFAMRK